MDNRSETFFHRTLNQKTDEARQAVDLCIKAFLSHNSSNRQSSARDAFEAVDRLVQLLHEVDRPNWLASLHQDLRFAVKEPQGENGVIALRRIASKSYPLLARHKWNISDAERQGFDFDAVYEKYRSECRITELFDELINCLKEIVNSGAIDSISALRELEKVITTLKSARAGSYFATRGAWYFAVSWFKNTGWELLGSIPIGGSVVKGLQKTLEETNKQMQSLHEEIQADFQEQIARDFPRLEYRQPALPPIELSDNREDEQ